MSTCKEHDLSKIAKIEAYHEGSFGIDSPVYLQNLTVSKNAVMFHTTYNDLICSPTGTLQSADTTRLYLPKELSIELDKITLKVASCNKSVPIYLWIYRMDSDSSNTDMIHSSNACTINGSGEYTWDFEHMILDSDGQKKFFIEFMTQQKGPWNSSCVATISLLYDSVSGGSEIKNFHYKNSSNNNVMCVPFITISDTKKSCRKIPFTKDSAKLDDKQDISVAGRVNTITLSWKWQPNTQADYDWLLDLQNNPHELLITYFGGTQRIVRTSPDAYKFTFEDNDGDCKCKMTLVNGQGFTRILDE